MTGAGGETCPPFSYARILHGLLGLPRGSPKKPLMIAHTIQLALAPVFVLVAIGNIMNILSTRLGRIVDRARKLQAPVSYTHLDVYKRQRKPSMAIN